MMIDDDVLNELAERYMVMQKMTFLQFIEKELTNNEYQNRNTSAGIGKGYQCACRSTEQARPDHAYIHGPNYIVKGTGTVHYACTECSTVGFRTFGSANTTDGF